MNIKKFTELTDKIIENKIPAELMKGLNLGISIIPDTYKDEDCYVMGEYIVDQMGCSVLLYYGSFSEVLEGEPKDVWIEEIKDTILHELQHHVESLAGEEYLADLEEEE